MLAIFSLDESTIKSFYKDLKGTLKIVRKTHSIGHECKNRRSARSKIILNIELYESCEFVADKNMLIELESQLSLAEDLTMKKGWLYSCGRFLV